MSLSIEKMIAGHMCEVCQHAEPWEATVCIHCKSHLNEDKWVMSHLLLLDLKVYAYAQKLRKQNEIIFSNKNSL